MTEDDMAAVVRSKIEALMARAEPTRHRLLVAGDRDLSPAMARVVAQAAAGVSADLQDGGCAPIDCKPIEEFLLGGRRPNAAQLAALMSSVGIEPAAPTAADLVALERAAVKRARRAGKRTTP